MTTTPRELTLVIPWLMFSFYQVHWIDRVAGLSNGAKALYKRLAAFAGFHGTAWPSQWRLEREHTRTPRTVRR